MEAKGVRGALEVLCEQLVVRRPRAIEIRQLVDDVVSEIEKHIDARIQGHSHGPFGGTFLPTKETP